MTRFSDSIKNKKKSGLIPVIPDIKLISPKEGELTRGRDPVKTAMLFEHLGAPALSVVTEEKHFGGSVELLRKIAAAVDVPVLRKDFITDEAELYITKEAGAAAVLLICATTDRETVSRLYYKAGEIGLEPLVETHTKDELLFARSLGAGLVGINNRDIAGLEKDSGGVSHTKLLAAYAPEGACIISESGIETPADARAAIKYGADAALVGTALWLAADTASFYREMCGGETR
ncbi:MAG: indole-3-glycerol-phosphate synthase [Clostridia bacterium]|nr:indole-3-glycerol-phosphate synthase [Clostridia bacterium]